LPYAPRGRKNIRPSADDSGKPGGHHGRMDDYDHHNNGVTPHGD
jgi:hypothetical protein